jgi:hypothetical protein
VWAKLLTFDPVSEEGDFSDLYHTVVNDCASLALYEASLPFVTALAGEWQACSAVPLAWVRHTLLMSADKDSRGDALYDIW